VDFEPRYVLVDGLGMIRAYYFTAQPNAEILLRDINFLLAEATNSTGSKKLAYEAAHLFLCYPD
jgi:protein SCO1/2